MLHRLKLFLWVICHLCVSISWVEAATWHEHRLAGFRAFNDGDYTGAVEQFEAALVIAYEEEAPANHLGAILENLAVAFLFAGQPQRAWEAIERWGEILVGSVGEPWVAEHQSVRDELAPQIREALARTEPPRDSEPSDVATPAPPESGGYAIHLESLQSEDNVQSSWAALKGAYPSQLSQKSLLVKQIDLGVQGNFYRILAAPFAKSEDAERVCRELKGLGQYCAVLSLE